MEQDNLEHSEDSSLEMETADLKLQAQFRAKLNAYQMKVKVLIDILMQERDSMRSSIQELQSKLQSIDNSEENDSDQKTTKLLLDEMRSQLAEVLEERDTLIDRIQSLTQENNSLKEQNILRRTSTSSTNNELESESSSLLEFEMPVPSTEEASSIDSQFDTSLEADPKSDVNTQVNEEGAVRLPQKKAWTFSKNNTQPKETTALRSKSTGAYFEKEKKILLSRSEKNTISPDSDEEENPDIIVNIGKNNHLEVKGGTLVKLVERLTYHRSVDPDYLSAFLLTYRSFTTSLQLFKLIEERFYILPLKDLQGSEVDKFNAKRNIIQLRVCNLIKIWLEKYFQDFEESAELHSEVSRFVGEALVQDKVYETLANQIKKLLQNERSRPQTINVIGEAPPSIVPKSKNFVDFDPIEVARQLTIIDHEMFRKVKPKECLNQNWSKPDRDVLSPNVVVIIKRFNHVSNWVATEIVKEEKMKDRECRNLSNYNAVMEILSGLQNSAIYRLKKTWEKVEGTKTHEIYTELLELMSNTDNYKLYRNKLKLITGPCVPYLGMFLTDLTFIGDGNPDTLHNRSDFINFDKRSKTAFVISEIQQCQQTPYNLQKESTISEFLQSVEGLTEKALYKFSLICEPRGTGGRDTPSSMSSKSLFRRFKFDVN